MCTWSVCVLYVYIYIYIHSYTHVYACVAGATAAALITGPNGRQAVRLIALYGLQVQASVNKLLDTITITAGQVKDQLHTTISP
jgi:hypothetical protein